MTWFNFFSKNACAITGLIVGATKALTDNYWLFTLPLIGKEEHTAENGAYLFAQAIQGAILWSLVGICADKGRLILQKLKDSELSNATEMAYGAIGP